MTSPTPQDLDAAKAVEAEAPTMAYMSAGAWRTLMRKAGRSEEEIALAEVAMLRGFIAGRNARLRALADRWDEEAKKMAKQREYDIEGTLEDCASELRAILGDNK